MSIEHYPQRFKHLLDAAKDEGISINIDLANNAHIEGRVFDIMSDYVLVAYDRQIDGVAAIPYEQIVAISFKGFLTQPVQE